MVATRNLDLIDSDATLPEAADVVVVGAGIIGVSTAWHLAKAGHSVALIEKGVVAGEQSSRNWGWCRTMNRDEREIPLMMHSQHLWDTLPNEIGADMGFRRNGLVYVTKDPKQLADWKAWLDMAQPYQMGARMIDATEAKSLTPGNEQDWIGGVVSPRDGRGEPAMAAPALAKAARARAVSRCTRAPRCARWTPPAAASAASSPKRGDHDGLADAFARRVVREPAHQIGGQPKGRLGAHCGSESNAVIRVERGLAGNAACTRGKGTGARVARTCFEALWNVGWRRRICFRRRCGGVPWCLLAATERQSLTPRCADAPTRLPPPRGSDRLPRGRSA